MYKVLYRKWRPKTFSDVVGQEQVTATLENELKSDRISHAYLFTGSKGTGKTTCAKILSKAINCQKHNEGNPCNNCNICRGIDNGSILDVIEIDAASNNGVENIRSLRQEANFTPATTKYRVYIIDEVHMLSVGAFNALLKILEEPPKHVVFILATTEVHKIPATILSRCQRFNFNRIPVEVIAKRLNYICDKEDKLIDDDAAILIAKLSDGALRDALSILDQCISKSSCVTSKLVADVVGLVENEYLYCIMDCIINKYCEKALNMVNDLYIASKDMSRLCVELLEYFREIMLIKIMKDSKKVIAVSKEDYKKMCTQANSINLNDIIYGMNMLQSSSEKISKGVPKRTEIEMCLIKLCTQNSNDIKKNDEGITISKTENKYKNTTDKINHQQTENTKSYTKEIKSKISVDDNLLNKNEVEKDNQLTCWPEILKILKSNSHVLATALSHSKAYIKNNKLLIDSKSNMVFDFLKKSSQQDNLISAIQTVTGKIYSIEKYIKETSNNKNDPLDDLVKRAKNAGIPVKKL